MGFVFNRRLQIVYPSEKDHKNIRRVQGHIIRSPNSKSEAYDNRRQSLSAKDLQFLKSIGLKIRK